MCNADLTVFGAFWVADIDAPFVDFNTKHKCKDFQPLMDWVNEHEVPESFGLKVSYREGDIILPHTP